MQAFVTHVRTSKTHLRKSARASPDPHNEELMDARPDQEEMDEAINRFLLQLEKQGKKGFKDLASVLSQLPKPAQGSVTSFSVADAIEAGFLPALDKDQADMFTPSELLLGYPRISRDNLHSTRISLDIPGNPWICNVYSMISQFKLFIPGGQWTNSRI